MLYDNRKTSSVKRGVIQEHVGFGIVVANDGKTTIRVLWDARCKQQLCEYFVKGLNGDVIFHVR